MASTRYPSYVRDMAKCIDNAVIEGKFFGKTQSQNTHMEKHVADKDCADVLDRVFKDNGRVKRNEHSDKEHKSINSGFYSLNGACEAVEECMLVKSLEVASWVDNAKNNEKKSFDVCLPPEDGYEPVGYGYVVNRENNTIDEYQTNTIRIVLQKNDKYPLGFSLLTAYPDIIREESRQPTGRDLTDVAKRTKTFKEASPTAKAYMLYQTGQNKPYLVTFKEGYNGDVHDDVMSVHIPYKTKKGEECKHIIRIKENSIELSTSKMMDVKVAKWTEHGRPKEKVIYPTEDVQSLVRSHEKQGHRIVDDKRYIKVDSIFTRKYIPEGEKGRSVDLTRDDVFTTLSERLPKAAEIVLQSCDAMGIKKPEKMDRRQMLENASREKTEKSVKLNESLLPRETREEKIMSIV